MPDLKDQTETARNIFTLVRDAFLALILLMLVGCPAQINQRLKDAGLDYVKGPGFEWQRQVEEAREDTKEVQRELNATEQQLRQTLQAVEQIEERNPRLQAETRPIRENTENTLRTIDDAKLRLDRSLKKQEMLIEEIEATGPKAQQ